MLALRRILLVLKWPLVSFKRVKPPGTVSNSAVACHTEQQTNWSICSPNIWSAAEFRLRPARGCRVLLCSPAEGEGTAASKEAGIAEMAGRRCPCSTEKEKELNVFQNVHFFIQISSLKLVGALLRPTTFIWMSWVGYTCMIPWSFGWSNAVVLELTNATWIGSFWHSLLPSAEASRAGCSIVFRLRLRCTLPMHLHPCSGRQRLGAPDGGGTVLFCSDFSSEDHTRK